MSEIRVKFRYERGTADDNRLNLYDGAKSLEGIARALTITIHACLNGEVRTRADSATGAELYIRAPQSGSFIYEASIFVGGAISTGIIYDFVKYAFNEAVGLHEDEPQRKSLRDRIEPTIGELPAVLETALIDVHRPMLQEPEMKLLVTRPRGEILAEFTQETGLYLQPQTIALPEPVIGNVTRYITISRWGKLYDRSEKRIISFLLNPDLKERERSLITWSLHESNMNRDGRLYVKASAVVSPTQQRTKRYLISKVSQEPIP